MPISGLGPVIGLPSSRTSPLVNPCRPDIDQSKVVLPQPEGPTIETISPGFTSRLQRSIASRSPEAVAYTLVALRTSSLGEAALIIGFRRSPHARVGWLISPTTQ